MYWFNGGDVAKTALYFVVNDGQQSDGGICSVRVTQLVRNQLVSI